jgi:murein L,D-transpeptidase YafK
MGQQCYANTADFRGTLCHTIANASVPRDKMGGNIYVHGRSGSIGCIAIGDAAIEEVFTLVSSSSQRMQRLPSCRGTYAKKTLQK